MGLDLAPSFSFLELSPLAPPLRPLNLSPLHLRLPIFEWLRTQAALPLNPNLVAVGRSNTLSRLISTLYSQIRSCQGLDLNPYDFSKKVAQRA